jgi:hypothetical protein
MIGVRLLVPGQSFSLVCCQIFSSKDVKHSIIIHVLVLSKISC